MTKKCLSQAGAEVDRVDGFKPAEIKDAIVKHSLGGAVAAAPQAEENKEVPGPAAKMRIR